VGKHRTIRDLSKGVGRPGRPDRCDQPCEINTNIAFTVRELSETVPMSRPPILPIPRTSCRWPEARRCCNCMTCWGVPWQLGR
jgi:hypothetical protein